MKVGVVKMSKCTCGSKLGRQLPKKKGLWEVFHVGCDYPSGGCDCYCGINCATYKTKESVQRADPGAKKAEGRKR
jgi:hypothetical protein